MLTGIINEDRHHLSLVQRHGWQGTEEGRGLISRLIGDIAGMPALFRPLPTVPLHQRQMMTIFVASSTKIVIICRWCSGTVGRGRKRAGIPAISPMSREM
jgi:hypothetical protein